MIKRTQFAQLVKDALASLHDYAALETHPLLTMLPRPQQAQTSRAEHLRDLLLRAIEKMRPEDRQPSLASTEWRPYLILHGRYVEGAALHEMQDRLSLSTRHLCREHGRALNAIVSLLWDQASLGSAAEEAEEGGAELEELADDLSAFEVAREPLEVAEVLQEVLGVFRRRAQSTRVELSFALPAQLPPVQADRIILRQILLALLDYALRVRSEGDILIGSDVDRERIALWVRFRTEGQSALAPQEEQASLQLARYWAQRFGGSLQVSPLGNKPGSGQLLLVLPRSGQPIVLVVDDQEPAIRMFQRYLSRTGLQVLGVREPEQVLALARRLQPRAITLDVMMPTMDGWELLQSLQADPDTRNIPVLVCSVWDVPGLAFSYGAAGYLKKPITQQDLLGALADLQLVGRSDAGSPTDT